MFSNSASIACDPPLGSITTVDAASVSFNVAINTTYHTGPKLDVRVWYQFKDGWQDLCLSQIPSSNDEHSRQLSRFKGILENLEESPRCAEFTLKIIVGDETHWVKDVQGQLNGVIIFQGKSLLSNLEDFLDTRDRSWKIKQVQSDISTNNRLWICRSTIKASKEKISSWNTLQLGQPVKSLRWFALVRHSTPWLGPRHGDSNFRLDKPGVLVSFLTQDGSHLVVLPVNGINGILTILESDDAGHIVVKSRNDKTKTGDLSVIVAVSKSFEQALAIAISQLKVLLRSPNDPKTNSKTSLLRDFFHSASQKHESKRSPPKAPTPAVQPELSDWHDGFSYCTWNSLGRSLSEPKILSALSSLSTHGIKIANLIIDDNWQSLDTGPATNIYNDTNKYRWTDFEANKEHFPNGLAHLVKKIREAHPHIRHIAVWHGLFGYWGGISPSGYIAKRYKTIEITRQTGEYYLHGGTISIVAASDVARMYNDFYAFLASCGVDAVKTDTQFYPDYIEHAPDRAALIFTYQDAWLAAVQKHFAHRGIACMAQTPQILFHSLLARDEADQPPYLLRNSDDFSPENGNQSDEAQAWHIFCNAHNAVLTQYLNVLPDWDMFQTAGGAWARVHAAARCLSGGPVYVTDVPGEHDIELIQTMTAVGRGGALRVLRPEEKGRAIDVYQGKESRRFLRIGSGHLGMRLLGLFNLGQEDGMEIVTRRSFVNFEGEAEADFLVKRYEEDKVHILDCQTDATTVALKPKEFEILAAYPITSQAGFRLVVLGLLGKMTGVTALSCQPEIALAEDASLHVKVSLKALGVLGIWLEDASQYLARNLVSAMLVSEKEKLHLKVESTSENIVSMDLESIKNLEWDEEHAAERAFEVEIWIKALGEEHRSQK